MPNENTIIEQNCSGEKAWLRPHQKYFLFPVDQSTVVGEIPEKFLRVGVVIFTVNTWA